MRVTRPWAATVHFYHQADFPEAAHLLVCERCLETLTTQTACVGVHKEEGVAGQALTRSCNLCRLPFRLRVDFTRYVFVLEIYIMSRYSRSNRPCYRVQVECEKPRQPCSPLELQLTK